MIAGRPLSNAVLRSRLLRDGEGLVCPVHRRQRANEHFLNLPRDSDGLRSEGCQGASACVVTRGTDKPVPSLCLVGPANNVGGMSGAPVTINLRPALAIISTGRTVPTIVQVIRKWLATEPVTQGSREGGERTLRLTGVGPARQIRRIFSYRTFLKVFDLPVKLHPMMFRPLEYR
jgi:hypothetical protein